ncbi:hypothetical protein L6452_40750 [Arctium lappa]|uniref:Uncharacterized protein n=1 Tax=Arctium lappa TaxID=4217 RepID=A0ACB8XRX8_ARCLA|nr:hypothetical protein L6452_40750 [Arctium lappa]
MASSPSSKGEGSKVNEKTVTPRKRPKHKVAAKVNEKDDTGSDVSRLNIPQKPNVVTTPSGVRVILPSVRNDANKQTTVKDKSSISPSKANNAKSKKQVGISKSPLAGKGSKSSMKKNSPMSHVKANSPKRKRIVLCTRVLDYLRKQMTHDRDDTYESPTSNSKFPCSMTTRSHASKKKELNVKRKAEGTPIGGNDIYLTDPAPRAKCVKVAWRKQFPGKRVRISAVMKIIENSKDLILFLISLKKLLYADITECKKLDVERWIPSISVWNMENLRRREYLELGDGGFGTWKLIEDDGIQKERPRDVFAERSEIPKISAKSKLKDYKDQIRAKLNEILAQKQIAEITIEKAISDFSADLDLRTLDMEFHNLFNPHDGYTEDQASKDKDQSPITTVGLQLVPGIPLETSQYWNNPRTHIELDDTFNRYGKKKEFKAHEITKMDLGFSPDKHLDRDSLRSPYVKRTVAIDALETSSKKKICAWINAAIEPICEPVFETTTGIVALRGKIESLCARTEIYSNVNDSWAAFLNHEERFRSKTSPRRLFMHSAILHNLMIQHLYNVGHSSYDSFAGRSFVIADCEKFNALDIKERARLLQYAEANRETRLTSI